MKLKLYLCFVLLLVGYNPNLAIGQDVSSQQIPEFNKIVIGPGFDVILEKSDKGNVDFTSENTPLNKITTEVKGKTLYILLEGAKYSIPNNLYPKNPKILARIGFKNLEKLSIRGDGMVLCKSDIDEKNFQLKSFGDNEILLKAVYANYFKASLFGDSKLTVHEGKVQEEVIKLYGDHNVDLANLKSETGKVSIFGDGSIDINAAEVFKVTAFGDGNIHYVGSPDISRKLVLGDATIKQYY